MVWVYLLIISILVLGLYGFIGTILCFFFSFFSKKEKLSTNLFRKKVSKDESLILDKFKIKPLEDRLNLLNYRQVLKGDNKELKINLISMLSFNPIRENVQLIKIALFDENEIIRILAANSLQKMDDYFINKITKLEEKLSIKKNVENYFNLAVIYDDYIYSSLLPEDLEDFYIEKMLEYYKNAYEMSNKDKNISEKYIRACIRFNKLSKARSLINEHLKIYPESISVKLWYCDFLLKDGNYKEIYEVLKSIKQENIKKYPKLYKSYSWWLKQNA